MKAPDKPDSGVRKHSTDYHEGLIERLKDEDYYNGFIKNIQGDAVKERDERIAGLEKEDKVSINYIRAQTLESAIRAEKIEILTAENEKLRETLGLYAGKEILGGKRARECLEQLRKEKKGGGMNIPIPKTCNHGIKPGNICVDCFNAGELRNLQSRYDRLMEIAERMSASASMEDQESFDEFEEFKEKSK